MSSYKSEIDQKNRYLWLFLLIALCVNLLFLVILFLITTDYRPWHTLTDSASAPVVFEEMPKPPPPPPPDPHEVAALKPGASQLGIPEDFKEEDYFEAAIPPDPQDAPSEEPMQQAPPPQETPIMNTSVQAEQSIQKPITDPITIKQVEASFSKQAKQEQPPTQQSDSPKKTKGPIQKELQFNDLARGFLNSLNEGGNDLMERKGNENIRPDFEEMRYLSYMHKIIWYMQNEWRRNQTLMNSQVPPLVITGVSVTINKDGVVQQASIIQSCGNNQIDEAIIQGIRAASPYPPLPAHFKKDIFTAEFGIKHVGNYYRSQPPGQLRLSF